MSRLTWTLWALCVLALPAAGQEAGDEVETVLVEVSVTASSGRDVFVDRGRDDGLEPGDRARFLIPGNANVEGTVRSVASGSARVELDRDAVVEVGFTGRIRIPADRLSVAGEAEGGPAPPVRPAVEHPPWTQAPEEWNADLPLLAPPEAITPEKREDRISGRAFLQSDYTWDREGEDARTFFGRAGTALRWENPFARGGQLQLDAELALRDTSFEGQSEDDAQSTGRLQRLSYAWGGDRRTRRRWEVGRFLQRGFPFFGLLDGVEVTHRFEDASYLGFSAGFLPEPNFELSTGEDSQAAVYYRRDLTARQGIGWGLGLQKTWNNGAADRDLIASDFNWRVSERWSVRGSALVDFYTSNERAKDAGLELTELHLFGNWRPGPRWGGSLSYDQIRWPDIDREEFVALPPDELRERRSERLGLRLWRQVAQRVRLAGRADLWRNEDDEGSGGELRVDWRDLLWSRGQVSATVFANDGEFSTIQGLRVGFDRDSTYGYWSAYWELANTEQEDFQGSQQDLTRQSLRASWDRSLGKAWSFSLFVDQLFGDSQGATTLGFYLQRRL